MRNLLIDIESLSDAKKRRLRLIQEGAIDPTSGLASESWYYAQDDSEWADDKIAGTNLSMEGWGCAISSVAMVLSYYEEDIKPDDIAENISYFSSGNLVWSEVAKAASEDFNVYDSRHLGSKGVDEDDLMDYVDSGYPVIVFIRADSSLGGYPKGHYVVVHGYDDDHDDFVVHDPIGGTGPNSLLQTSKDYVSELYGGVTIDQMIVYKPE
jgi:ABC-type bacteriocin/lantibiotic exporter with double-glycine peptidase domain